MSPLAVIDLGALAIKTIGEAIAGGASEGDIRRRIERIRDAGPEVAAADARVDAALAARAAKDRIG